MTIALRITTPTTPRHAARRGLLPLLGLGLLLGACSSTPEGGLGDGLWAPFSGARNVVAADSLTVQRVRGTSPEVQPLLAEPGNVWPEPEAPRVALLGNPDEAMRNIPDYRPSLVEGSGPPARSPFATPPAQLPPLPAQAAPQDMRPRPVTPLEPRAEGRILTDPSGRPAIGTGQSGRVGGFTQPGVGGGAVIRDGNVETWIGPDGQSRTRVVPPGQ